MPEYSIVGIRIWWMIAIALMILGYYSVRWIITHKLIKGFEKALKKEKLAIYKGNG